MNWSYCTTWHKNRGRISSFNKFLKTEVFLFKNLSLPVWLFFTKRFWGEGLKKSWRTLKISFFKTTYCYRFFFMRQLWIIYSKNNSFWCIFRFQIQTPSLNGPPKVFISHDLRKKYSIFTLKFVFMPLIYVLFQMACLLLKVLLKYYST